MPRHLEGALAERSRTQLGLVTTDQAAQLGLSEQQLRTIVDRGGFHKRLPRVIEAVGAPASWERSLLTGLLQLGPSAVVSHAAAAALHELDGVRKSAVEFTVVRGQRHRVTVGKLHSSLQLGEEDLTVVGLFPTTTIPRTILDCSGRFAPRLLEQVVDAACRDGRTCEAELRAMLDRLPGRRGSNKLRKVLDADSRSGRPHTWLERRLLEILRQAGLPEPRMQVQVDADGKLRRIDAMYEVAHVAIEVAGHRTHSTRRQRQEDAERRLQLEWQGYRVLEFTYEDVTERPGYVTSTTGRWLSRAADVTDTAPQQRKR